LKNSDRSGLARIPAMVASFVLLYSKRTAAKHPLQNDSMMRRDAYVNIHCGRFKK